MSAPAQKDQVLFGAVGATLSFEAAQGRPFADGSVTLVDPREAVGSSARTVVTGTASRKAVSTTLTAAAGAAQTDPRNVPCVPPAVLSVGDYVWLTNVANQRERRRVIAKATASITVDDPLVWDYATGATLDSAVMTSPAVPTVWAADEDNVVDDLEAVWTYTVAGVSYTVVTRWDLVREVLDLWISDADILERFPDARRFRFASSPDSFEPQIRAGQKMVLSFLAGRELDPDRLRGSELVRYLVVLATLVVLADNAVHPNKADTQTYYERRLAEYNGALNDITSGRLKIPYDADEDGVLDDDEREFVQPMLRR